MQTCVQRKPTGPPAGKQRTQIPFQCCINFPADSPARRRTRSSGYMMEHGATGGGGKILSCYHRYSHCIQLHRAKLEEGSSSSLACSVFRGMPCIQRGKLPTWIQAT